MLTKVQLKCTFPSVCGILFKHRTFSTTEVNKIGKSSQKQQGTTIPFILTCTNGYHETGLAKVSLGCTRSPLPSINFMSALFCLNTTSPRLLLIFSSRIIFLKKSSLAYTWIYLIQFSVLIFNFLKKQHLSDFTARH